MKNFLYFLSLSAALYGQDGSPFAPTASFFERTVAQLSSLTASSYTGKYVTLTDGANACDLTIGGGSFRVPIVSNGTIWSAYGCGGGGADDSLTIAATTCNSTLATLIGGMAVTARTPGTSFTVTYNGTIATNPLCVSYHILN